VGLTFGPNGNLFVTSTIAAEVEEFNGTTGAFVRVASSAGGLDLPSFLVLTPSPAGTATPEPASLLLFGLGGLALAASRARRWAGSGSLTP
jgi:hypothetical protein